MRFFLLALFSCIYAGLFPVAMATKFETKLALTLLVCEIFPRALRSSSSSSSNSTSSNV